MKKKTSSSKNISIYIILFIIIILGTIGISWFNQRKVETPESKPVVSKQEPVVELPTQKEVENLDLDGAKLTSNLRKAGFNLGLIDSRLYKTLGFEFPEKAEESERQKLESTYKNTEPLSSIIDIPEVAEKKNLLVWDKYEITAPILYAGFEDIFQKNEEGAIVYNKFIDNNPIDSPVQLKLRDGIVHLPFSPSPGEVGNSYIIGHSSNYSTVKSDYNFIFAPLIEKVTPGEQFLVYDYLGRELTFKVFETKVVKEAEVAEAYKKYDERRVVTLQGSILETVSGKILPTKRYLVIAELVDTKAKNSVDNIDVN